MNSKTKWVTETSVMLALLIVLQVLTRPLGQLVTGSCVNFILASAALLIGTGSGLVIAVLSPFFAFLLGIGPAFLPIVPGICLGNCILVIFLKLMPDLVKNDAKIPAKLLAVLVAASAKFSMLFLLVTKAILPTLGLAEKQAAAISASLSWPQLITALIGSLLAVLLSPRLSEVIKENHGKTKNR